MLNRDYNSCTYFSRDENQCLLKIFNSRLFSSLNRIEADIASLRCIPEHPNICKMSLLDVNQDFIVLRYAIDSPSSLSTLVQIYKKLPLHVCISILAQILMAISIINRAGFCHSLLTPENIFINEGIVSVSDYAIAGNFLIPARAGDIYRRNAPFLSGTVLRGQDATMSSDAENAVNIFDYINSGVLSLNTSSGDIIEIINLDLKPYGSSGTGQIHGILKWMPDSAKDAFSLLKGLLDTSILYKPGINTGSGLFNNLVYTTRMLLLQNEFYH